MQKIFGLFIAIFAMVNASQAQQNRWYLGGSAGACISTTSTSDTLANLYSSRNRVGGFFNVVGSYELNRATGIHFGFGLINKGYKINCDSIAYNTSINSGITALNANLGLSFKQQFSSSNFIMEKFGAVINYNISPASTNHDTIYNTTTRPSFRINQTTESKIYPLFYLGFAMGGTTESGNRYEFNVTYQQSFATSHNLQVQTGEFWNKTFDMHFRGGNLQLGITYYFNIGNFTKNQEYFY